MGDETIRSQDAASAGEKAAILCGDAPIPSQDAANAGEEAASRCEDAAIPSPGAAETSEEAAIQAEPPSALLAPTRRWPRAVRPCWPPRVRVAGAGTMRRREHAGDARAPQYTGNVTRTPNATRKINVPIESMTIAYVKARNWVAMPAKKSTEAKSTVRRT